MWGKVKWWLWFGGLNFLFFVALSMILHTFIHKDEEEIAMGIQMVVLGGVYAGRYLANLWVHLQSRTQNQLLLGLAALIVAILFMLVLIVSHLIHRFEVVPFVFFWVFFVVLWINLGVFSKLLEQQVNNRIKVAELNAANSKSELQLLQSQLSPHFLFNTLNNLYGISLTEHEKIPSLLLKLSELLRYSVYSTSDLYVPLQDEIDYLDNYIAFERIRLGQRLNLVYEVESSPDKSIKIAPMLLIVFVENAFKHAKNTHDKQIFINISLKTWGNALLFSVKNSHAKANPKTDLCDDTNGFGLVSVQKRLALLYKQAHDLSITETEKEYLVMLRLDIK